MNKYNLILIENKQCIPFLNYSQQAFYDKLWEWTYEDDLWDYIDGNNPSDEELEQILFQFINENMFHKYEDDDIDCFAFINDGEIKEYVPENDLFDFIKFKVKEHYGKI